MKTKIKNISILFLLLIGSSFNVLGGNGDDQKKSYPIEGINGIDINIACELYISQDSEESLRIEAKKDIIHYIDVEKRDSILYLTSDKDDINYNEWDVEVYLTVKTLKSLNIGGAAKVRNSGTLKGHKLSLDISGAADLELRMEVKKLLADFSGAVKAELEGRADYIVMDMSGASKVDAEDLISDAFYLDFSGFGKAEVYASKVLKVDMSGMGVVRYSGNPEKVDAGSSGLGVIKPD
jgi:hypothetical protein